MPQGGIIEMAKVGEVMMLLVMMLLVMMWTVEDDYCAGESLMV